MTTKEEDESAEEDEGGWSGRKVMRNSGYVLVAFGTWRATLPRVDSVSEGDASVRGLRFYIEVLGRGPVREGRRVVVDRQSVGNGRELNGGGGERFGGGERGR